MKEKLLIGGFVLTIVAGTFGGVMTLMSSPKSVDDAPGWVQALPPEARAACEASGGCYLMTNEQLQLIADNALAAGAKQQCVMKGRESI